MTKNPDFGPLLRRWRSVRGLSQQALASDAEVSTRHLSCIETGKARPSRQMVLVLASALDLPLRERNALLLSAGFAPAYDERSLDSEDMTAVRRALGLILERQEPYPAIVVDSAWNLQLLNQGAQRMALAFGVDFAAVGDAAAGNALHALFHPDGIRRFIVNWDEVAAATLHRLQRDIRYGAGDERAEALLRGLLAYPGIPERTDDAMLTREPVPFLPVHLRRDGLELSLFTTLTTLGTPRDVTAEELTIESYFPADDATRHWFEGSSLPSPP